jgi:hypothetical protein
MYVYAAQVWLGFLMLVNNTHAVWNDIISLMKEIVMKCPDVHPSTELWGGAISDVQHNDTTFAYRDALFNVGVQLRVFEESDSQSGRKSHSMVAICSKVCDGCLLSLPDECFGERRVPTIVLGKSFGTIDESET